MVLSYLTLLPPVLDGLQLLWVCVIVAPLLSTALLAADGDPRLMHVMPDKNKDHLKVCICAGVGLKFFFVAAVWPFANPPGAALRCI